MLPIVVVLKIVHVCGSDRVRHVALLRQNAAFNPDV